MIIKNFIEYVQLFEVNNLFDTVILISAVNGRLYNKWIAVCNRLEVVKLNLKYYST